MVFHDHDLQAILDEFLRSKYSPYIRAQCSLLTLKSGCREKYFNLSPNQNFGGRSINVIVAAGGDFQLGASFAKVRARELEIDRIMRNLTGNQPVHGTFRNGTSRIDTLRCSFTAKSRYEAAYMFIRFYDLTEEIIRDP